MVVPVAITGVSDVVSLFSSASVRNVCVQNVYF